MSRGILQERLRQSLEASKRAHTHKLLRYIDSPMGPVARIDGLGEVVVLCSNNYLGLADHPKVVEAAQQGLRRYGAGTASVRFICGTLTCHRELEERLAAFFGAPAALTYTSCWNANEGLLPALAGEGDAIISDETNHASIIDATRLSRAHRRVYAHASIPALLERLGEVEDAPLKVVVSDGVFSMEGDIAPLPELARVCREADAVLVIDDSHGTGVLGASGRGVHEHFQLSCGADGDVQIITSTLGKALGGGNGGFVLGSAELVDHLIQSSRPHLFSNALAPSTACAAIGAIEVLDAEPERIAHLRRNVARMREGLMALGYDVVDSPSAIIPIIVGDTARALRLSQLLLERGIFVVGFGHPVVPEGRARLRVQMSAAHEDTHIDRALDAFDALRALD
ncbi:MAG: aminotransferase class I/II-fold pyridoxal phosphate-dependent enzyme [Gammaproteobacteria bacterium]|nr:aminotransferase class I/II-fold pyridoxal phosphate-dependent enzyme [Gammaproteobacteria bacterium]